MSRNIRNDVPDHLLLRACEMLAKGESASRIAEHVSTELGADFTREQVYPLLRKAWEKKLLFFAPSINQSLATKLASHYGLQVAADSQSASDGPTGDAPLIEVLNVKSPATVDDLKGPSVVEHLAVRAAELAHDLIWKIWKRTEKPVHVGWGAGRTTWLVAQRLSSLLKAEPHRPQMVLHALTGGWDPHNPRDFPAAHFASFVDDDSPFAEFVNLSAPPLVDHDQSKAFEKLDQVEESRRRASELEIVITSLGNREDSHCLFSKAMNADTAQRQRLKDAGWVGDVQFRPYSATGPLKISGGLRAS